MKVDSCEMVLVRESKKLIGTNKSWFTVFLLSVKTEFKIAVLQQSGNIVQ